MARLFDFMKYDKDERGADVDESTRLELRRLANLFLLSAITLVLLLLLMFRPGTVGHVRPSSTVKAVLGGLMLLALGDRRSSYGVYVTYAARRWTG